MPPMSSISGGLGSEFAQTANTAQNLNLAGQERAARIASQDATSRFNQALGGTQIAQGRNIRNQFSNLSNQGTIQTSLAASQANLQNQQFGAQLAQNANQFQQQLGLQTSTANQDFSIRGQELAAAQRAGRERGNNALIGGVLNAGVGLAGLAFPPAGLAAGAITSGIT